MNGQPGSANNKLCTTAMKEHENKLLEADGVSNLGIYPVSGGFVQSTAQPPLTTTNSSGYKATRTKNSNLFKDMTESGKSTPPRVSGQTAAPSAVATQQQQQKSSLTDVGTIPVSTATGIPLEATRPLNFGILKKTPTSGTLFIDPNTLKLAPFNSKTDTMETPMKSTTADEHNRNFRNTLKITSSSRDRRLLRQTEQSSVNLNNKTEGQKQPPTGSISTIPVSKATGIPLEATRPLNFGILKKTPTSGILFIDPNTLKLAPFNSKTDTMETPMKSTTADEHNRNFRNTLKITSSCRSRRLLRQTEQSSVNLNNKTEGQKQPPTATISTIPVSKATGIPLEANRFRSFGIIKKTPTSGILFIDPNTLKLAPFNSKTDTMETPMKSTTADEHNRNFRNTLKITSSSRDRRLLRQTEQSSANLHNKTEGQKQPPTATISTIPVSKATGIPLEATRPLNFGILKKTPTSGILFIDPNTLKLAPFNSKTDTMETPMKSTTADEHNRNFRNTLKITSSCRSRRLLRQTEQSSVNLNNKTEGQKQPPTATISTIPVSKATGIPLEANRFRSFGIIKKTPTSGILFIDPNTLKLAPFNSKTDTMETPMKSTTADEHNRNFRNTLKITSSSRDRRLLRQTEQSSANLHNKTEGQKQPPTATISTIPVSKATGIPLEATRPLNFGILKKTPTSGILFIDPNTLKLAPFNSKTDTMETPMKSTTADEHNRNFRNTLKITSSSRDRRLLRQTEQSSVNLHNKTEGQKQPPTASVSTIPVSKATGIPLEATRPLNFGILKKTPTSGIRFIDPNTLKLAPFNSKTHTMETPMKSTTADEHNRNFRNTLKITSSSRDRRLLRQTEQSSANLHNKTEGQKQPPTATISTIPVSKATGIPLEATRPLNFGILKKTPTSGILFIDPNTLKLAPFNSKTDTMETPMKSTTADEHNRNFRNTLKITSSSRDRRLLRQTGQSTVNLNNKTGGLEQLPTNKCNKNTPLPYRFNQTLRTPPFSGTWQQRRIFQNIPYEEGNSKNSNHTISEKFAGHKAFLERYRISQQKNKNFFYPSEALYTLEPPQMKSSKIRALLFDDVDKHCNTPIYYKVPDLREKSNEEKENLKIPSVSSSNCVQFSSDNSETKCDLHSNCIKSLWNKQLLTLLNLYNRFKTDSSKVNSTMSEITPGKSIDSCNNINTSATDSSSIRYLRKMPSECENSPTTSESKSSSDTFQTADEDPLLLEDTQDENDKHPTGIVFKRSDYYTIPPMNDLIKLVDKDGKCIISNFTIGFEGYGKICFEKEMDIVGLNLDEIVNFLRKQIIIYPDNEIKPPVGFGLNCEAKVTLDKVWPLDKSVQEPITDPQRLLEMNWEGKLQKRCSKKGTRFVEYCPETGSWVFLVPHFSRCALDDDSDDETVTPGDIRKVKIPVEATDIVKQQALAQAALAATDAADRIKNVDNDMTLEVLKNSSKISEDAAQKSWMPQESLMPGMFDQSQLIVSQGLTNSTDLLAKEMGTDAYKFQLMKGSLDKDDINNKSDKNQPELAVQNVLYTAVSVSKDVA